MKDKMKAAVLTKPGCFEISLVEIPEIEFDDALIKVDRCGICGTDLHIFNGHYASDSLPLILGHEFTGTVASLGKNVHTLNEGQQVVVDTNVGCGYCYFCRRNEVLNCSEVCQIGITRHGAFAEYVSVPARLVISVQDGTPPEVLALTEPLGCVVRAARKSKAKFGQSVAIIGAGPIGNLHIQLLRAIGLAPIIVFEIDSERAQFATDSGADSVVATAAELKQVVKQQTEQRGVDLAIESVGNPELYALASEIIRPGGHIAAFGLTGEGDTLPLNLLETVLNENSIKGSVAAMGEDMHDALTLLRFNRIDPSLFLQSETKLDDIQATFESIVTKPKYLKTQVVI